MIILPSFAERYLSTALFEGSLGNNLTLTPTQLDRYKRHILLKEIGGAGQTGLCCARAC